jgi:hypothetical protein
MLGEIVRKLAKEVPGWLTSLTPSAGHGDAVPPTTRKHSARLGSAEIPQPRDRVPPTAEAVADDDARGAARP